MYITEKALLTDALYRDYYQLFPPTVIEKAIQTDISVSINNKASKDCLIGKLDKAIDISIKKCSTARNDEWACYHLLIEDLKNLQKNVSELDNKTDIDEKMESLNVNIIRDINDFLGLNYAGVPIYINDHLPHLFRNLNWLAANVRPNDLSDLPAGIYFAKVLMSEYSELLLYHENIHVAIEPNDDNYHYILWLDEGAADVLSAIYLAKKYEDWQKWVSESIRKREKPLYNSRIRAWNDKIIAFIIMTYGMDFLRFLLYQRKHNPQKVKWHKLYNYMQHGKNIDEMSDCFPYHIKKERFKPNITDIEKKVCALFLTASFEKIVLHPISYCILKKYLDTKKVKDKFFRVTYEELSKILTTIDSALLKTYSKEINGVLSVGADEIGLKAWDSIGYYKDTDKYNLIFADASLLYKHLEGQ